MDTSLFQELFAAAQSQGMQTKQEGETRFAYLKKLSKSIATIPEQAWKDLSQPAKDWYNLTADNINADKEIPFLAGFDAEPQATESTPSAAPAADAGTAAEGSDAAPAAAGDPAAKPEKAKAAVKPPKEKKEKAVKAPKAKKEESPLKSLGETIRQHIIDNPLITSQQIKEKMLADGFLEEKLKMSSITTYRMDALAVLRIAEKSGWKRPEGTPSPCQEAVAAAPAAPAVTESAPAEAVAAK